MTKPIYGKWKHYLKENVKHEPSFYAVYVLADNNLNILYIGEGQLKKRLMAHFPDGAEPVVGASFYKYKLTGSKIKCIERQNALLSIFKKRNGKLPKFNQQSFA